MSALWGQGPHDSAVNVPVSPLPLRTESQEKMGHRSEVLGDPSVHRGGGITRRVRLPLPIPATTHTRAFVRRGGAGRGVRIEPQGLRLDSLGCKHVSFRELEMNSLLLPTGRFLGDNKMTLTIFQSSGFLPHSGPLTPIFFAYFPGFGAFEHLWSSDSQAPHC